MCQVPWWWQEGEAEKQVQREKMMDGQVWTSEAGPE